MRLFCCLSSAEERKRECGGPPRFKIRRRIKLQMQTPSACKPAQSGYNAHDVKTRVWQIFLFPFFKFRCQNIKYHKYKYIFVCVCVHRWQLLYWKN